MAYFCETRLRLEYYLEQNHRLSKRIERRDTSIDARDQEIAKLRAQVSGLPTGDVALEKKNKQLTVDLTKSDMALSAERNQVAILKSKNSQFDDVLSSLRSSVDAREKEVLQ